MQALKLRSPAREQYWRQPSPVTRSVNLAHLSRSASTQTAGSSKYGFRGEKSGDEGKCKAKGMTMLTRGASFRRQGSSGMTWADNWIFTDDGMFLGRHSKVADEKNAQLGIRPTEDTSKGQAGDQDSTIELTRSLSANGSLKRRSHNRWGFKWIKKSFKKAFR